MYHFTLDLESQLRKYYGFKIHQVLNLPVLSMPLLPHVMCWSWTVTFARKYCKKRTSQCCVCQGSGKSSVKAWHTWHKLTLPCATQRHVCFELQLYYLFQSNLSNFGSKENNTSAFPYQKQTQKFQPLEVISTNHLLALKYITICISPPLLTSSGV